MTRCWRLDAEAGCPDPDKGVSLPGPAAAAAAPHASVDCVCLCTQTSVFLLPAVRRSLYGTLESEFGFTDWIAASNYLS